MIGRIILVLIRNSVSVPLYGEVKQATVNARTVRLPE
jgi:hypothetical protein